MPMSSINRVVLVGNLTRDPELRTIATSGNPVCHLRVACNSRRKVKEEGIEKWVDRPHYFDVSVFGPQAVTTSRYLRRGRPVGVDGRLEWREWEQEGKKRQSVSIIADTVQFLGAPDPRPAGEASGVEGASQAATDASSVDSAQDPGAEVPSADAASSTNGAGLDPVPVAAGSIAHEKSSAEDGDGAEDLTF